MCDVVGTLLFLIIIILTIICVLLLQAVFQSQCIVRAASTPAGSRGGGGRGRRQQSIVKVRYHAITLTTYRQLRGLALKDLHFLYSRINGRKTLLPLIRCYSHHICAQCVTVAGRRIQPLLPSCMLYKATNGGTSKLTETGPCVRVGSRRKHPLLHVVKLYHSRD